MHTIIHARHVALEQELACAVDAREHNANVEHGSFAIGNVSHDCCYCCYL